MVLQNQAGWTLSLLQEECLLLRMLPKGSDPADPGFALLTFSARHIESELSSVSLSNLECGSE